MTDFGITPQGFVLKRLVDIRQDLVDRLSQIQDPVSGEFLTVDLKDENDPLVQLVNSFSDGLAVGWEQTQGSYNQFDPLKASNGGLSGVVQLNGIRRKTGTVSRVIVTLEGTPNLLIPTGNQFTDIQNTFVWQLPQVLLDVNGYASAEAQCIIKGPNTAIAGTLVKILTPIAGWDSITNSVDAIPGTLEETDSELRARQQLSTSATASSIVDAIFGSLIALADVDFVRVYQNSTLVTDSRGIPGKTVAVVIVGGDDDDIGTEIFEKQSLGMDTFGTTIVSKTDVQGINYPIRFTRPAEINIYVQVDVTVVNLSIWPSDGADQIKVAILAYAAGYVDLCGISSSGYVPGSTVYSSELYVPVNSVQGTQITSLLVGISGPPGDQSVSTEWNKIPFFDSNNIEVMVTL